MPAFQNAKLFIVDMVGLDKDALHIYVAVLVFLLACVVMRWKISSWKPWAVVLVLTLMGEVLDYRRNDAAGTPFVWDHHWKDIWNSMLMPTVLVFLARFTGLFERPAKPNPEDD